MQKFNLKTFHQPQNFVKVEWSVRQSATMVKDFLLNALEMLTQFNINACWMLYG